MTSFSDSALKNSLRPGTSAITFAMVTLLTSWAVALDEAAKIERPLSSKDFDHWAFRPLAADQPPAVHGTGIHDEGWVRNEIDQFILARLENEGLVPQPEADRATLLRRLSFDLRGLPPSPEELDSFLADDTPDAYEKRVDRILSDIDYGERWAQHWLDLARFAETDGFEHDKLRINAWRYRDWVIDAFNRDLPYDEFLKSQVAGDELFPGDAGALVATGFSLCGPDMPDINSQKERRHMVLNDITSTIGSVFLGLQFQCAQCHDHKWDPLSQADFYRLRSFFENAELFRDQPLSSSAKKVSGDAKKGPRGRVLLEKDARLEVSYLRERGNFARLGPRVEPAYPRISNVWNTKVVRLDADEEKRSSGLRSQLSLWLTRPDHPLVTRVIANRIWQHHFGRGIVSTPSDLGTRGQRPSHPALLDWLATELPRRDWSIKGLHRLIVTSATYRQAGRRTAKTPSDGWNRARELDPTGSLYWKSPRRRLEAEALRDALLEVSGLRSYGRGGPGVMPPLPAEVRKSIRRDHWKVSPDIETHYRRSIYLFVRRNLRYPFFEVFDRPDTNASCAKRSRTTIAPQSLALLNSDLSMDAARHLAGRLLASGERDDDALIRSAYLRALGRAPEEAELNVARGYLQRAAEEFGKRSDDPENLPLPQPLPDDVDDARGAAISTYCLALINLNEFLYIE